MENISKNSSNKLIFIYWEETSTHASDISRVRKRIFSITKQRSFLNQNQWSGG